MNRYIFLETVDGKTTKNSITLRAPTLKWARDYVAKEVKGVVTEDGIKKDDKTWRIQNSSQERTSDLCDLKSCPTFNKCNITNPKFCGIYMEMKSVLTRNDELLKGCKIAASYIKPTNGNAKAFWEIMKILTGDPFGK